jgi:hypothetical protein
MPERPAVGGFALAHDEFDLAGGGAQTVETVNHNAWNFKSGDFYIGDTTINIQVPPDFSPIPSGGYYVARIDFTGLGLGEWSTLIELPAGLYLVSFEVEADVDSGVGTSAGVQLYTTNLPDDYQNIVPIVSRPPYPSPVYAGSKTLPVLGPTDVGFATGPDAPALITGGDAQIIIARIR